MRDFPNRLRLLLSPSTDFIRRLQPPQQLKTSVIAPLIEFVLMVLNQPDYIGIGASATKDCASPLGVMGSNCEGRPEYIKRLVFPEFSGKRRTHRRQEHGQGLLPKGKAVTRFTDIMQQRRRQQRAGRISLLTLYGAQNVQAVQLLGTRHRSEGLEFAGGQILLRKRLFEGREDRQQSAHALPDSMSHDAHRQLQQEQSEKGVGRLPDKQSERTQSRYGQERQEY